MLFPKKWPSEVRKFLGESYGKPVSIERLGGVVYEESCFRIKFLNQSVIIKQTREQREWFLYKDKSSFLRSVGVNIPVLYYAYTEQEMYWLIIEDIPLTLPKNRWEADTAVLEVLFCLHYGTWKKELTLTEPYIPGWNVEMLDKALACFPTETYSQIKSLLDLTREQCQQLFKPLCWISGDPNPTNWGFRHDGTTVLFDWERIGYGHPAVDLAITMPGLNSNSSLESLIATKYLDMWEKNSIECPFTQEELTYQITLAKVWSVVEFLANNAHSADPKTIDFIIGHLPEKLSSLRTSII
ncbi:phosphotransferase [Bacillus sp. JJ722]|uniref:phosphotransferase n=1 Tax=Bacillus sp. JJ722 TaxID=3122973 RepID=UPI0030006224